MRVHVCMCWPSASVCPCASGCWHVCLCEQARACEQVERTRREQGHLRRGSAGQNQGSWKRQGAPTLLPHPSLCSPKPLYLGRTCKGGKGGGLVAGAQGKATSARMRGNGKETAGHEQAQWGALG